MAPVRSLCALLGYALAIALLEARAARVRPAPAPHPVCTLEDVPPPPPPPASREWRAIPGVGARRARALADARWTAGPGFEPTDVRGIGPVVGAAVRLWLAQRAASSGGSSAVASGGPDRVPARDRVHSSGSDPPAVP